MQTIHDCKGFSITLVIISLSAETRGSIENVEPRPYKFGSCHQQQPMEAVNTRGLGDLGYPGAARHDRLRGGQGIPSLENGAVSS